MRAHCSLGPEAPRSDGADGAELQHIHPSLNTRRSIDDEVGQAQAPEYLKRVQVRRSRLLPEEKLVRYETAAEWFSRGRSW